jgi:hypothetical protein
MKILILIVLLFVSSFILSTETDLFLPQSIIDSLYVEFENDLLSFQDSLCYIYPYDENNESESRYDFEYNFLEESRLALILFDSNDVISPILSKTFKEGQYRILIDWSSIGIGSGIYRILEIINEEYNYRRIILVK